MENVVRYIPANAPAETDREFDFSIIIAVYNTEGFIRETIDSLIAQQFSFDRVQLILVDDGSADESPAICDEYADMYPENVFVYHKPNGGVSSARNVGLEHATGKFINFLDSDDLFTPETLVNVYRFFIEHITDTDVVAVPMFFFEAQTGPHILNNKFKKGSRIIDLTKEPECFQNSSSSAFMKRETVERLNLRFDTGLKHGEDAKFMHRLLRERQTIGVMNNAQYMYRRRASGELSAVQGATKTRHWWLEYPRNFHMGMAQDYMEEFGEIPAYVQNNIVYDLKWRADIPEIPEDILTAEEAGEHMQLLRDVMQYIDTDIIMAREMFIEYKLFFLRLKYGAYPKVAFFPSHNAMLYYDELNAFYTLNNMLFKVLLTDVVNGKWIVEGIANWLEVGQEMHCVKAYLNDRLLTAKWIGQDTVKMALGQSVMHSRAFRIEAPVGDTDNYAMKFLLSYDFGNVVMKNVSIGPLMPISRVSPVFFSNLNGWALTANEYELNLKLDSREEARAREFEYLKWLWNKNGEGMREAAKARFMLKVRRHLKRKQLWLISDRINRAGDNGEALFRYMMEHKDPAVDCRFIIAKDSVDYEKMKAIGPVVEYGSKKHKRLQLIADRLISSGADEFVVNPFGGKGVYYRDILSRKPFIFLQHGITEKDMSGWLNRLNKNLRGFVTAAIPEQDSIVNMFDYYYTERESWLTGFPRFDRLYRDPQKKITIMPTWRRYLMGSIDPETGIWELSPNFVNSDYFRFYSALLKDKRLLDAADKYGYKVQFYPHPNIIRHVELFEADERIKILDETTEYRTIYAETELIVSDYSSAIFDFVYLRQPVVYAQFDAEQFFGGSHTCKVGYFDYEQDGFGEVEHDLDSTVDRVIEYMKNGCKMKPKYKARADKFFAHSDKNSCQRVYEKIKAIKD